MGPRSGKPEDQSIYSSFINYDDVNLSNQLNAMFHYDFSSPPSL